MPLLTTVPISTMKPMREIMVSCWPVTSRPIRPPVKASGTVNSTMKGDSRLWNCATMTRYTKGRARAIHWTISLTMKSTLSVSPPMEKLQPSGISLPAANSFRAFCRTRDCTVVL